MTFPVRVSYSNVARVAQRAVTPVFLASVLFAASTPAFAQMSYFKNFPNHSAELKSVQPDGWQVPLVTSSAKLCQLYRAEFDRQITPARLSTWNIGNGKGLFLILNKRTEFDTVMPNYVSHNDGKNDDGFGDYSITSKTRLFSGDNRHGAYIVSAQVAQTFSTGQLKNGAVSATRIYTLMGGKGFGKFNVQSTAGVTIPAAAGMSTIGKPVAWNTTIQSRLNRFVWAEVEDNETFYNGGSHNGKKQNYITPGLILAGLRPRSWSETDHRSFILGAGMQLATSTYKPSNHNLVLDAKMCF